MAQYTFPRKEFFSFSHRECKLNLQKGSLRNKMYLNFKIFCVKRFRPIIRVENDSQEKFPILHVPQIGFVCYLDSEEIFL